jgi:hypothetical protein
MRRLCLLVALSALVGCGSAQSKQSAEFVARATKLCREATSQRFWEEPDAVSIKAVKELRTLLRANEHLPLVRSWLAAVAATKRARLALAAAPIRTPASRKLFRREVTIYDAERSIPGIGGCAQSPFASF